VAKVYYSALVNYIKGRLGDLVYSKHLGTPYIKYQPVSQYDPKTPRQLQLRANLIYLSKLWDSLSPTSRNLWQLYASLSPRPLSAHSAFISLNLNILNSFVPGLTTYPNPPKTPATPITPKNFCAYNISGSCIYLSWTDPLLSTQLISINYRLHYNLCTKFPTYGLCPSTGYRPSWRYAGTCFSDHNFFLFEHDFPDGAELFFRSFSLNLVGKKSPKTFVIPIGVSYNEYFYVADPNNYRICKFLKSDMSFVCKFGSFGSGDDNFSYPVGIFCSHNQVFVTDQGLSRLSRHSKSDLSFISKTYGAPPESALFNCPGHSACDEKYLYIIDTDNHRIQKRLLSDYSLVDMVGSNGTGDLEFDYPYGLAIDHDYIYIADLGNCRIQILRKTDLSFFAKFGTPGLGNYQFNLPLDVCVDLNHIFVSDQENARIVKYLKSDRSYVGEFGSLGSGPDNLDHPNGIAVDYEHLYIVDSYNSRIVKLLKSNLTFVNSCGEEGSGEGDFEAPEGIGLDDIYFNIFGQ
jgi:hypothetical protein